MNFHFFRCNIYTFYDHKLGKKPTNSFVRYCVTIGSTNDTVPENRIDGIMVNHIDDEPIRARVMGMSASGE